MQLIPITSILNWLKRFKPLAMVVTALAGAFLFVYLLGPAVYDVNGLVLKIFAEPARVGKTVIDVPPLGNVSAQTHKMPFELHLQLEYIGTDLARDILGNNGNAADLLDSLRRAVPGLVFPFALRQVVLGGLGAFLTMLLIWRSRFRHAIAMGLGAALLVTLILVTGAKTYDLSSFNEPEYSGVISLAPEFIPEPQELLNQIDQMEHHTRKAVGNIRTLFAGVNGLSLLGNPEEDNSISKVLLVSDLHSNPIGVEFISGLTNNFKVDLIVDAGDLTDFGSPLETTVTEGLNLLDVPYVFSPGNHDTPETMEFIKSLKKGMALEGEIKEVAGLKILGSPDPLASSQEVTMENQEELHDLLDKQAQELIDAASDNLPDITVVHHPRVATKLTKAGFPLVIYGHTHQAKIQEGEKIQINPGTSGAAGVRGLYAETSIPYSAVILYIKAGEKAVALDTIKYDPLSDRFFIERKLLRNNLSEKTQPAVIDSPANQPRPQ